LNRERSDDSARALAALAQLATGSLNAASGNTRPVQLSAVLMDIGGVLEINPPTGWQGRWARRLGHELDEFERALDELWRPGVIGAATLAEIEQRTARTFGLSEATVNELLEDAWREYLGTLNQELHDWFRDLRPHLKTGIVSNSFVGAREREQQAYGFDEICDVIVYSHEVGALKPDARIYHLACELLGVQPHETVLVDDDESNVAGARAIGMNAILFSDNRQAIAAVHAAVTA
jgi:putative hydrolase of the HAD superfamily